MVNAGKLLEPQRKSNCFKSCKTLVNPQESQRSLFAQTAYRLSETLKGTKTLEAIFIIHEESNCETPLSKEINLSKASGHH